MINIQLEYDKVENSQLDEKWIHTVCKNILNDNRHNHANITIIFSNDNRIDWPLRIKLDAIG